MIKNYKMILMYDGSRYKGWEHQPGTDMTIQGKIENVLEKLAGEFIEIYGCGRTDAGVHAREYVANFRMKWDGAPEEIRDYMNRYLPDDICVTDLREASDRFHARYNAVGKIYCYTCYVGDTKPVFNRKYVCAMEEIRGWMGKQDEVPPVPDMELMKQGAQKLIGIHDFAAFCSNPRMKKSTVRKIDYINIERKGDLITFTYHGSGFLQHMVRILTGTLLEIGFGKRESTTIEELYESKDRKKAGFTAPSQGLCLMKVEY